MAFALPDASVLTAAPQSDRIPPSLGRFTKLYAFLLVFLVYTGITFASEHKVDQGKEYAKKFFGHGKNVHGANATSVKGAGSMFKKEKLENRQQVFEVLDYSEALSPDPSYGIDYTSIYETPILKYVCSNTLPHIPQTFKIWWSNLASVTNIVSSRPSPRNSSTTITRTTSTPHNRGSGLKAGQVPTKANTKPSEPVGKILILSTILLNLNSAGHSGSHATTTDA
jgi:hypothetical protein